ncbi:hypothetical protein PFMALIP_02143 [Plasmodium falciparum MaliPS096_E11]|uniref:Uncharacterized protein n=1 Tax=Plasmodium falciparum MaliPS096_E11 TaxID=1036727 RepID=A0A024WRC8_PLAFA|nr:hypothetical protein PFMALIP_02143 [Plasmodium falciparum MaliPS096_E11]
MNSHLSDFPLNFYYFSKSNYDEKVPTSHTRTLFQVVISKSFSNAFLSMYDIINYVLKKDNIIDYTHMIKNNGSVPLAYLYTYYIG